MSNPEPDLARLSWNGRLSLRTRLTLVTTLMMLALLALSGWQSLQAYRAADLARRDAVRQNVETASATLAWAHRQEAAGAITRAAAQQLAREMIRGARYGGKEYFWINDMDARVVMHPIKPELEGKDASGIKDPEGRAVFVSFVNEVRSNRAGFVNYMWPKPGQDKPVGKVSYVVGFEPWGWVLGSGMYTDDLRASFLADLQQGAIAAALVITLLGLLMRRSYVSIRRDLDATIRVAEAISHGDVTTAVASGRRDEIGRLLTAMYRMQSSLAGVVSAVRANAESVATASSQIAQGNQDLSGRTEQQASALQQAAATMEELGTTVRQNADNAQQANQLAQGASTIAIKGGDVVGQVVATMKGISDSSRRISEIIATIDSIAFQTNILALNAAVEAARAGEQGQGFAVVASEVRSLAQRSAEAAREIKSLIRASVDCVERGTTQVDEAGRTMTEVVASIRRVSDIVAEISAASAEQSSGVNQVGQAVAQLDRATQQNAALVEQSTAAAESLKSQAGALVHAVAAFKLTAA